MTVPPELQRLEARLKDYRGAGDDPAPREGGFLASVALILRIGNGLPEILLIKRAEAEGDPWSGHMALPGGRYERGDGSLLETATRETLEETGLRLEEAGEILGRLDLVSPRTPHLPPLSVLPFVFAVPGEARTRPGSPEVAEIHWISLERLRDPGSRTTHRISTDQADLSFPAFRVANRTVWGLTHRILLDLLGRFP